MTQTLLRRSLTVLCLVVPASLAVPVLSAPVALAQAAPLSPDAAIGLMERGDLTGAEAAARAVGRAHPESARARLLLARVLARQGDWPGARAALAEARRLPQWDEEGLGVPFESPRTVERVMLRDPLRAESLLADVRLAEGDDPRALYLLAVAQAMGGKMAAARESLRLARQGDPALAFAHPETLASLERSLARGEGAAPFQTERALAPPEPLPWWVWALAVGGSAGAGLLISRALLAARAREERRRAGVAAACDGLRRTLMNELNATEAAADAPRLDRLRALHTELSRWEAQALAGSLSMERLQRQFARAHAATESDAAFAAYQAELAAEAERARQAEAERAQQQALQQASARRAHGGGGGAGEPSAFRPGQNQSWSSGRRSGGGGGGGKKW